MTELRSHHLDGIPLAVIEQQLHELDTPNVHALCEALWLVRCRPLTVWMDPEAQWPADAPAPRHGVWESYHDGDRIVIPAGGLDDVESAHELVLHELAHVIAGHMCDCELPEPCIYRVEVEHEQVCHQTVAQLVQRWPSLVQQPMGLLFPAD